MTTDALPGLSLEVVPPPPEQDVLRTDVAAVLGRTRRGPVGVPVRVQSRLEYESWFGPVDGSSATPLAVRGFFENNGRTVWVLRVSGASGTASRVWAPGDPLPGGLGFRQYRVLATSPGAWANGTRVRIRYQASSLAGPPAIMVRVAAPGEPAETFPAMPPDFARNEASPTASVVRASGKALISLPYWTSAAAVPSRQTRRPTS